jgi:hypothetical protein
MVASGSHGSGAVAFDTAIAAMGSPMMITMPAVIAPIQRNMACSFRFTTRSQQNRDEGTGVPPMKIQ